MGRGFSQAPQAAQRQSALVHDHKRVAREVHRVAQRLAPLQLRVRLVLVDREDVQPSVSGCRHRQQLMRNETSAPTNSLSVPRATSTMAGLAVSRWGLAAHHTNTSEACSVANRSRSASITRRNGLPKAWDTKWKGAFSLSEVQTSFGSSSST